jgi:DNA-binding transcriptional regulator/RsmH inhibitor MraZ
MDCEEAQEKGGTFTYEYLLVVFTMFKWTPPARRQLVLVQKGHMEKMFEPWHSRADLENTAFKNSTFSKWYNAMIDTTQRLCIPQELLNCNMGNISFIMNRHHTVVWSRHVYREEFYSRMMSFYLDEEAFKKEVILWPGVKHNPRKSRMHYILPAELLKKKGKEAGVRLNSGPEA